MKKTFSLLCVLTVVVVSMNACQPARMALSDEGLSSRAFRVEGRRGLFTKERMSFEQYHTTRVKRSWTRSTNSRAGWGIGNPNDEHYQNLISTEYIRRKQTVKFELADNKGNLSEVYCVSKFNAEDLQIGNRPNSIVNLAAEILLHTDQSESHYYVQLYTNKYERPWQLIIDNEAWQGKPATYRGLLAMDKEHYYTLVPVRRLQGKDGKPANILFGSIGFEILDKNNKPVAAVSLIDKGVIYLADLPAEERFLLANTCAALLMQEQLG